MNQNDFKSELKKIGITPTTTQLDQLNLYYELLKKYNKYMNLTTIIEKKDVYLKHFYDSLTIIKIIDLKKIETLCDIGTGAGFPGVVLKIFFPNLKITLIDSLNKRIKFLNDVISQLKLDNIIAIHGRIEDYAIKNREVFDMVTSRAVASLNILLEYSIPILKVGGNMVAMKSNLKNENYTNALLKLNSNVSKVESFLLPIEKSRRTLILIKKEKETSYKYPRKYAVIKAKPL